MMGALIEALTVFVFNVRCAYHEWRTRHAWDDESTVRGLKEGTHRG